MSANTRIKVGSQVLSSMSRDGFRREKYRWRTVTRIEGDKVYLAASGEEPSVVDSPNHVLVREECGNPNVNVGDKVVYKIEKRDDAPNYPGDVSMDQGLEVNEGYKVKEGFFVGKVTSYSSTIIEVDVVVNPYSGLAYHKSEVEKYTKPITYWCIK